MSAQRKCERCGRPLSGAASDSICSACAAQLGQAGWLNDPYEPATRTATALDPTPLTETADTVIGRYKLLEKLGEGGFGVVWAAEQREPVRRRVALKIIKLGMDTRQVVARFEAERQALALMDHPNIAKVLDAGATDTGRPYFVMELVKGIPITKYCDEDKLATPERLDLFIRVCQAIQHAHQKGIIHRDIKPSNILVTLHDGVPVPKVIDFGIAKATQAELTEKTIYTQFNQFIGTPAYMSPEQAEISGLDIDTRSDIYSLGVLLYEMLTGTTPFDTKELLQSGLDEMRRIIREREPLWPSARLTQDRSTTPLQIANRKPQIANDLDWIVMKCLEKHRARRYETANGLATDIKRHLNNEPVVACPPTNLYRLQKLVQRNRLVFAGIGGILAALLLGAVGSIWQAIRASAFAKQAQDYSRQLELKAEELTEIAADLEMNLYAADVYLAQNAIREGNFGLAQTALRAHVPQSNRMDVRGFEWCYFWAQSQGHKLASWHAHSNVVNSVAVSPDGSMIASAGWDHVVRVWHTASQQLLASFPDSDTARFSPDGRLLFTAGHSGRVQVIQIGTWDRISEFSTGDEPWEYPTPRIAISPQGSTLAVCMEGTLFGGRGSVRLYDYATGKEFGRLPNSGDRMAFSPDGRTLVTGSVAGQIKVWNVATREVLATLSGIRGSGVCSLALSPDGRLLATTEFWSSDVCLWDVQERHELAPLLGHTAMIWSVAFSPDGRLLASSSSDQTIRLWDVESRTQVRSLHGHESEIWAVAFSPTGEFVCSGSKDETVAIWPSRSPEVSTPLPPVRARYVYPVFSSDGSAVVAPSARGLIVVDTMTGQVKAVLPSEKAGLWFAPDNQTVMTIGTNDAIHLWDVATSALTQSVELTSKLGAIGHAIVSNDGRLIAGGFGPGRGIQVWETSSGGTITTLSTQLPAVGGLVFSLDGRQLAVWGGDRIEVWDVDMQTLYFTFVGHKDGVSSVAFLPGGDTLASSSVDNTAKLWSVSGRKEIATLRGHREGVLHLSLSPDGKTLATASGDQSIKLWNIPTRREVAWFRHSVPVVWVGFSPSGGFLAFICDHNQLKFLRAPVIAEIDKELSGQTARSRPWEAQATGTGAANRTHAPRAMRTVFRDTFDGALKPDWTVIQPHEETLSLVRHPGKLTITTQSGGFHGAATSFCNLVLTRDPPPVNRDFEVEVTIEPFELSADWQQAGVILWADADNYFRWVLHWNSEWRKATIVPVSEWQGRPSGGPPSVVEFDLPLTLGITKRELNLVCWIQRAGGPRRILSSDLWLSASSPRVGLVAKNGEGSNAPSVEVQFDDFEVRIPE